MKHKYENTLHIREKYIVKFLVKLGMCVWTYMWVCAIWIVKFVNDKKYLGRVHILFMWKSPLTSKNMQNNAVQKFKI